MSAPLSSQFEADQNLATGMFGAPRGRIAPRGSYVVQGVGDPAMGYSGYGYFWHNYPALIAGTSDYAAMSTTTGAPVGTPAEESMLKAGGGPTKAEIPDYGGTAAY